MDTDSVANLVPSGQLIDTNEKILVLYTQVREEYQEEVAKKSSSLSENLEPYSFTVEGISNGYLASAILPCFPNLRLEGQMMAL